MSQRQFPSLSALPTDEASRYNLVYSQIRGLSFFLLDGLAAILKAMRSQGQDPLRLARPLPLYSSFF